MKSASIKDIPHQSGEIIILDVRTAAEHAEIHLQRAHDHVPLDQLDPTDFMLRRGLDKDAALYIMCRGGTRAKTAAQKFIDAGYTNIHVLEGGITAATEQGEPVVKTPAPSNGNDNNAAASGESTVPAINTEKAKEAVNTLCSKFARFSPEAQGRLIAGTLLVVTAFLGAAVDDVFLIVPLAIGAGMIYAGFKGDCGMTALLAKAPWNKGNAPFCATVKNKAESADNAAPPQEKAGGCA